MTTCSKCGTELPVDNGAHTCNITGWLLGMEAAAKIADSKAAEFEVGREHMSIHTKELVGARSAGDAIRAEIAKYKP